MGAQRHPFLIQVRSGNYTGSAKNCTGVVDFWAVYKNYANRGESLNTKVIQNSINIIHVSNIVLMVKICTIFGVFGELGRFLAKNDGRGLKC